jgi:regulator of sigma E protease
MEILIKALQLILSLSILVVLHELGHFIPAKLFKTRVEKFYLFFDPWFSLFKIKRGGTEYGVGWLPLGGYVKISGMIDESMDKEQMKLPPQPWEFRAKPAWQRLIIMIGGVTVNVILGMIIYSGILYHWGEEYLPTKNVKYGIAVDSTGQQIGLQSGDKILSVDNKPVENFQKIPAEIVINQARSIQVERNGEKLDLPIPATFIAGLIKKQQPFIDPRLPFIIEDFAKKSPGRDAGLMVGDKIVGINDITTEYFDQFKAELKKHKNEQITVKVIRNNAPAEVKVMVPEQALLGIAPKNVLELERKEYTLMQSIPGGVKMAFSTFDSYIKQLKLIVSPQTKAYENLGGFIMLGKAFSPEWDWVRFWTFTAFLSIVLAIMNILPIPALDGGHVMFLLYEVVTGRKPNEKFMEYAQIAGMVFLFSLLLYANGNDIVGLFN